MMTVTFSFLERDGGAGSYWLTNAPTATDFVNHLIVGHGYEVQEIQEDSQNFTLWGGCQNPGAAIRVRFYDDDFVAIFAESSQGRWLLQELTAVRGAGMTERKNIIEGLMMRQTDALQTVARRWAVEGIAPVAPDIMSVMDSFPGTRVDWERANRDGLPQIDEDVLLRYEAAKMWVTFALGRLPAEKAAAAATIVREEMGRVVSGEALTALLQAIYQEAQRHAAEGGQM